MLKILSLHLALFKLYSYWEGIYEISHKCQLPLKLFRNILLKFLHCAYIHEELGMNDLLLNCDNGISLF